MNWRHVAVIVSIANWVAFAAFLAIRTPSVDARAESEFVAGGMTFEPTASGHPVAYIAARPLYTWNSWHGGESVIIKVIELVNLPALVSAIYLAPRVTRILFPNSGSYYLQSWVCAWMVVVFSCLQWFALSFLVHRLRLAPRTSRSALSRR